MKLARKKRDIDSDDVLRETARKRFHTITEPDIVDWLENTVIGIGRALDDYRHSPLEDSLRDAKIGAVIAGAAIDELLSRTRSE